MLSALSWPVSTTSIAPPTLCRSPANCTWAPGPLARSVPKPFTMPLTRLALAPLSTVNPAAARPLPATSRLVASRNALAVSIVAPPAKIALSMRTCVPAPPIWVVAVSVVVMLRLWIAAPPVTVSDAVLSTLPSGKPVFIRAPASRLSTPSLNMPSAISSTVPASLRVRLAPAWLNTRPVETAAAPVTVLVPWLSMVPTTARLPPVTASVARAPMSSSPAT